MPDHDELRKLAEAAIGAADADIVTRDNSLFAFEQVANPARILALLDEVEALKRERDKWKAYVVKPATSEIEYDQ